MRLCADIGGSFVDMGIVDRSGAVSDRARFPTPLHDWDAFVALFRDTFAAHAEMLAPDSPLCLALAGLIDPNTGALTSANIPSLHGRAVVAELSAAIGRPVSVINDADAFALAEATLGAGQGHRRVFGIILGTGVGGGLVEDGQVLIGTHGIGGEWGHGAVMVDSPIAPGSVPVFACGCGRIGCLDTIGGARGLERLHQGLHQKVLDSRAIIDAWQAGDVDAGRTVDCFIDLLSGPLAMLVNTVGASILPVGGGLSNSAPLIARLDKAVRAAILRKTDSPIVVPGQSGAEPGLIGAAWLGLEKVGNTHG